LDHSSVLVSTTSPDVPIGFIDDCNLPNHLATMLWSRYVSAADESNGDSAANLQALADSFCMAVHRTSLLSQGNWEELAKVMNADH